MEQIKNQPPKKVVDFLFASTINFFLGLLIEKMLDDEKVKKRRMKSLISENEEGDLTILIPDCAEGKLEKLVRKEWKKVIHRSALDNTFRGCFFVV